jgi:hypothetical protein
MIDKVALRQVFSKYFGFPCQFSSYRVLHIHMFSGAGVIGPLMADIPSRRYVKKNLKFNKQLCQNMAYRPVARQRPRNKQLYNTHYYTAARKEQQRNDVFCVVRAEISRTSEEWVTLTTDASSRQRRRPMKLSESNKNLLLDPRWGPDTISLTLTLSEWVRGQLRVSRCELLLFEARRWGRGPLGNSEEGERPPLIAATEQRLT